MKHIYGENTEHNSELSRGLGNKSFILLFGGILVGVVIGAFMMKFSNSAVITDNNNVASMDASVISANGSEIAENTAPANETVTVSEGIIDNTFVVNDSDSEQDDIIGLKIDSTNIIKEVAADYNGENEELGGMPCVVNEDAIMYTIDWATAKELYVNKIDCIILFSAPWCRYCKAEIGFITDAAVQTDTPIYYVNAEKYPRPVYGLDENSGKIMTLERGADGYEELLELFAKDNVGGVAPYYIYTGEDSEPIDTGHYKIGIPSLISIKDGNVNRFHMDVDGYDIEDGIQEEEIELLMNGLVEFMAK